MIVKVRVQFYDFLRELVGKREEKMEFKKLVTVGDLIRFLAERYGRKVKDYLYEGDEIKSSLNFFSY